MLDLDDFRVVPSCPEYEINSEGVVIYSRTGNVRRTSVNAQGVLKVSVSFDGAATTRSVAVMVAEAFLTDPHPEQYNSIIHLNGDRMDCRVQNIVRRPRWFSIQYHRQFTPRLEEKCMRDSHYFEPETELHFKKVRDLVVTYGLLASQVYINTLNGERVWPGARFFAFVRN